MIGEQLKESKDWKDITNGVVKEFDEFIEEESMKVGTDVQSAVRPDIVITRSGLLHNPKIVTNKRR